MQTTTQTTLFNSLCAQLHVEPDRKGEVWIEVPLSGQNGTGKVAIVDIGEYSRISAYRWNYHKEGYATARIDGKQVLMHRFILHAPKGTNVDHINQNRLDNRRSNLRLADKSQNAQNARSHRDSTSQYKGVCWDKHRSRWIASIRFGGKDRRLGYFRDEVDAAKAYDRAAREYFGEFARVNFLESGQ